MGRLGTQQKNSSEVPYLKRCLGGGTVKAWGHVCTEPHKRGWIFSSSKGRWNVTAWISDLVVRQL